jgi:predicted ATP-grasp superfamily ATP-dependent carboligase
MKKIKVLITSAELPTSLGTVRAIANKNVEITGLCQNPDNNCCKSKYWNKLVAVEDNVDAYLSKLIELGKKSKEKQVLFISHDYLVTLVAENREILSKYYHFVLPDKDIVEILIDKTKFYPWALERGFKVPESYSASTETELRNVLAKITYPVVIKPRYREKIWSKKVKVHKVFKLENPEDYKKLNFDLFEAAPSYLIQKWIPGGDDKIHFCLTYYNRKNEELGEFTGQKLLQWYRYTGNTAVGVSTKNEKVYEITKRLFKEANFQGLGSVEFKYNEYDNNYYITEPTLGRNNLQSYIAVAGGVNLSKIALFDAMGMAARVPKKEKSAVWLQEVSLGYAINDHRSNKKFSYSKMAKFLFKLLFKYKRKAFCYFSLRDPMPFLYLFVEKFKSLRLSTPAVSQLGNHGLNGLAPVKCKMC